MSNSQPVEPWEVELESEIFAVRQWMVECEPEGLRYPVRARILGRLLDIAHSPTRPEVEKLAESARELMNSRTCTTSYKEYEAVEKLREALVAYEKERV